MELLQTKVLKRLIRSLPAAALVAVLLCNSAAVADPQTVPSAEHTSPTPVVAEEGSKLVDQLLELAATSATPPDYFIEKAKSSKTFGNLYVARLQRMLLAKQAAELTYLKALSKRIFGTNSGYSDRVEKLFSVASRADFLKDSGQIDQILKARELASSRNERDIFDSRLAALAEMLAKESLRNSQPDLALSYLPHIKEKFVTATIKEIAVSSIADLSKQLATGKQAASVNWGFAETKLEANLAAMQIRKEDFAESLAEIYSLYSVYLAANAEDVKLRQILSKVFILRPDPNKKNDKLKFEVALNSSGEPVKIVARELLAELDRDGQFGMGQYLKLVFAGFYGSLLVAAGCIFLALLFVLLVTLASKKIRNSEALAPLIKFIFEDRQVPGYQREATSPDEYSRMLTVLGLDDSATEKDIKSAYRELIKKYHPDKLRDAPESEQEEARLKHHEITTAYHRVLEIQSSRFGGR